VVQDRDIIFISLTS